MYIGELDYPLLALEFLVRGYYSALDNHGLVEPAPEMMSHFSTWLACRTRWSLCCGWAHAITSHAKGRDTLLMFFEFVDRYRTLVPETLCRATLGPQNAPTGKRIVIGFKGRIKRPGRIEIVRYATTQFYFLRFVYGRRTTNDGILMDGDGSHKTSLSFAKLWVADEFQVGARDWETIC